ncbi:esterase [Mixta tenebrionis]|uniref:Esterase n=1 Tax=Mixta tenebrionis TaxID=2562439 RepID=A0A506V8W1_9GAMM|nr:esterase [Mixta tenebrionis]TPW42281.1 esterase [Mixta tenebrionis]
MITHHFVVQRPSMPPAQLFLLYHAAGDNPVSMGEIGRWFAEAFPQALVVSVGGPEPGAGTPGQQWYSDAGPQISLQQRVDRAMPQFLHSVVEWQQLSGVAPEATALVGFAQGSVMVLEGCKARPELAGRIVAFSGRYASLPEQATAKTTIHLIHGEEDEIYRAEHAQQAAARLTSLGGDVTLDIVADLPHAIDRRSMDLALDHLRYTVPRRYFEEALSSGKPRDEDVITLI